MPIFARQKNDLMELNINFRNLIFSAYIALGLYLLHVIELNFKAIDFIVAIDLT